MRTIIDRIIFAIMLSSCVYTAYDGIINKNRRDPVLLFLLMLWVLF